LITGGMMPKAARGKFARPPAGTALAPYVGSHPEYVPDVSEIREYVTEKGTIVNLTGTIFVLNHRREKSC
jgi:Type ISP C-terminal specificity domain